MRSQYSKKPKNQNKEMYLKFTGREYSRHADFAF